MDNVLILLIAVAVALFFWLLISAVFECKDMQSLGLLLVVVGLFFGWPILACGVVLVIAHHINQKGPPDVQK
jgi:hypothetical protein